MIAANDVKAEFTYSHSLIDEVITVAGVEAQIWRDEYAENPYTNCDGMAPAIWFSHDRFNGSYAEYGDKDLERFFWHMSPAWISRHWRKIAAILDLTESEADNECKLIQSDYGGGLGDTRQEYFAERLADMRADTWGAACDYLETLAALYRLANIPADTFQSNGYCQGDSLRGLIVLMPAWCEAMGVGKRDANTIKADMQGDVKSFGAWAWGDCYGFTVDNEDSCGGFYGHDIEHMAEMIAESVNAVLAEQAKELAQELQAARPDMTPAYI
jgi:hypothetical protein